MKLRAARAEDEAWINARYAEVAFQPSDVAHELVLIASIDDVDAGLGRLVPVDEQTFELGGMLVFDGFRGRGVARAIIDALLAHARNVGPASAGRSIDTGPAEAGPTLFCIPFAELEPLYASAGFTRTDDAPRAIREKFEWCRRTYDKDVLLMRYHSAGDRHGR